MFRRIWRAFSGAARDASAHCRSREWPQQMAKAATQPKTDRIMRGQNHVLKNHKAPGWAVHPDPAPTRHDSVGPPHRLATDSYSRRTRRMRKAPKHDDECRTEKQTNAESSAPRAHHKVPPLVGTHDGLRLHWDHYGVFFHLLCFFEAIPTSAMGSHLSSCNAGRIADFDLEVARFLEVGMRA